MMMFVVQRASFSALILLEKSLTRLPSKGFHLFQRAVTMGLTQQTASKDQGQKRQTAHIELQKRKEAQIQVKIYSKNINNRPPKYVYQK